MMHPSRKAYVEEEPDVSNPHPAVSTMQYVHTVYSEDQAQSLQMSLEDLRCEDRRLIGWLGAIGHGYGGGPCKYS